MITGLQRVLHIAPPSLGNDLRLGIQFLSVGDHPAVLQEILEPARALLARRDAAPLLFPIAELVAEDSEGPTELDWEVYHCNLSPAFAEELQPSLSRDLDLISGNSHPREAAFWQEVYSADVQMAKKLRLLSPQAADDFLDIVAALAAFLPEISGACFVGDDLRLLLAFRNASRLGEIRCLLPNIFEIFERRGFGATLHPIANLYDAPRPEDWRAYRNRILDSAAFFLRPQFDIEIQDAFTFRFFFWSDEASLAQRRRTSLSRASYLAYYSAGLISFASFKILHEDATGMPVGGDRIL